MQGLEPFKSTPLPTVFYTEVLTPRDTRDASFLFDDAKAQDISGLMSRGTFRVVPRSSLPPDANIMGGRFVLAVKNKGLPNELLKARYVVQGHTDREKNILVHASTTARQHSTRLLVALAATMKLRMWTQDISQAYLQGAKNFQREVYLRPHRNFNWNPIRYYKLSVHCMGFQMLEIIGTSLSHAI